MFSCFVFVVNCFLRLEKKYVKLEVLFKAHINYSNLRKTSHNFSLKSSGYVMLFLPCLRGKLVNNNELFLFEIVGYTQCIILYLNRIIHVLFSCQKLMSPSQGHVICDLQFRFSFVHEQFCAALDGGSPPFLFL